MQFTHAVDQKVWTAIETEGGHVHQYREGGAVFAAAMELAETSDLTALGKIILVP